MFSTDAEQNGHRGASESEGMKLHGVSIKTGLTENTERLKKNITKTIIATRVYNTGMKRFLSAISDLILNVSVDWYLATV